MFWMRLGVIWFIGVWGVQAQLLPTLIPLPVQWQQVETWWWQGQQIRSQRFTSTRSVSELTQQIPLLIHQDLTALSLSTSRVLSFFEQGQHFLLVLSEQKKGTNGWLSSLDLRDAKGPQVAPIFKGLYEHAWTMQPPSTQPVYLVLRPAVSKNDFSQVLHQRLLSQGWQGGHVSCSASLPCKWEQNAQRLVFWQDLKQNFWHVLWWQS